MWCFFFLFQTVLYTLVGSPPGTDFFTLSSTGQISVSKDLNTDPARLLSYQVSQSIGQLVNRSVSQSNPADPVLQLLATSKNKAETVQSASLSVTCDLDSGYWRKAAFPEMHPRAVVVF